LVLSPWNIDGLKEMEIDTGKNVYNILQLRLHPSIVALKKKIETWTGISVSIGVGPNKVLSKVANRLAKKSKLLTGCVVILNDTKKIQGNKHLNVCLYF
jgi:hypothetical protein